MARSIPFTWEQAVLDRDDLSPAARLLALVLRTCMDVHGECWPGVPLLARRMGYSERVVQRARAELEDARLLDVVGRDGHANLYRARLDERGDVYVTPRDDEGVTPTSPGGDAHVAPGVTPTSPRTDHRTDQRTRTASDDADAGGQVTSTIDAARAAQRDLVQAATAAGIDEGDLLDLVYATTSKTRVEALSLDQAREVAGQLDAFAAEVRAAKSTA